MVDYERFGVLFWVLPLLILIVGGLFWFFGVGVGDDVGVGLSKFELEVHGKAVEMSDRSYVSRVESDFVDAGLVVDDVWVGYDEFNVPVINRTGDGFLTVDRSIINCYNGMCQFSGKIKAGSGSLDRGLFIVKEYGDGVIQGYQVYYGNSSGVGFKDSSVVDLRSYGVDEVVDFNAVVYVTDSLEFSIGSGDIVVDPIFNYSEYNGFYSDFFDGSINTSWWRVETNSSLYYAENSSGFLFRPFASTDPYYSTVQNNFNLESLHSSGINNVSVSFYMSDLNCKSSSNCWITFYLANLTTPFTGCDYNQNILTGSCSPVRKLWQIRGVSADAQFNPHDLFVNLTIDLQNRIVYCYSPNNNSIGPGFGAGHGCNIETDTSTVAGFSSSVIGFQNFTVGEPLLLRWSTYASPSSGGPAAIFTSWNVTVPNVAPSAPVWFAPANGSVISMQPFVMNWTNSSDVDGDSLTYNFEIDDVGSTFSSVVYSNSSIVETVSPTGVSVSGLPVGVYYARVRASDGGSNGSWSDVRVFEVVNPVVVSLNSPVSDFESSSGVVDFNCSVNSTFDLYNLTLFVDGLSNYSVDLDGLGLKFKSINVSRVLVDGYHNWSCLAFDSNFINGTSGVRNLTVNSEVPVVSVVYPSGVSYVDSSGNVSLAFSISNSSVALDGCWYGFGGVNYSFDCGVGFLNLSVGKFFAGYNVSVFANSSFGNVGVGVSNFSVVAFSDGFGYPLNASETESVRFKFNVSADGNGSISASFVWNGTVYSSTNGGNDTLGMFYKDLVMPVGVVGFKSFYWNLSYGGKSFRDYTFNHSLDDVVVCLCGSANCSGSSYINFTFLEESSGSLVNGSFVSSSWDLYVGGGDGSVEDSFYYADSVERESYAFCISPSRDSYVISHDTQYMRVGYPQRRYSIVGVTYDNVTDDVSLYLLNASLGSYVTIQVQNAYGTSLPGVSIVVSKSIGGVDTVVSNDVTGNDGSSTFWLNPNDDHTFTLSKSGFTTVVSSFRPTQSVYTITMGGSANYTYQSDVEGLLWDFSPVAGMLDKNKVYDFVFNVTSFRGSYTNLSEVDNCTIQLHLLNGSQIGGASGCSGGSGVVTLSFNTSDYGEFLGYLGIGFVDGGFVWVDRDMRWFTLISYVVPERGTVVSFFKYFKDSASLGDDVKRIQFTKITLFFFVLMICLGVLSLKTGWDLATGGGGMVAVSLLSLIVSYGGFLDFSVTPFSFLNRYLIAVMALLVSVGWTARSMR